MPDYSRIISLVQSGIWFVEPRRGRMIADAFLMRLEHGRRAEPYLTDAEREENAIRAQVRRVPMPPQGKTNIIKDIAIIPLIGMVFPRGDMMEDMSGGGAVNLVRFQREFQQVGNDESVGAILLEIDSPGGLVDMVQETAAMVRSYRKSGRPIIAIANTMAGSGAYWIASAADQVVVTPSGFVGSIGVFQLHQSVAGMCEDLGIVPEYIYEGARKVEGNPFEPLDDIARAAMQAEIRSIYESFTADVAAYRGADVATVRADPEGTSEKTFGGGRAYSAGQLRGLKLVGKGGMVDRIATMQETIDRLMGRSARTSTTKARLALSGRKV